MKDHPPSRMLILLVVISLAVLAVQPVMGDVVVDEQSRTFRTGVARTNCNDFGYLDASYAASSVCKAAMDRMMKCMDTCFKRLAAQNPPRCKDLCEYECVLEMAKDPGMQACMAGTSCPANSVPVSKDACTSDRLVTDDCCCVPGMYKAYGKCVPKAELPDAVFCGKNGCQEGENCASCEEDCACSPPEVCDPFGGRTSPLTYCSPAERQACIFVSKDMTLWEYLLIYLRKEHITTYYRSKGYRVKVMDVGSVSDIADCLANPQVKAMAYIGHAGVPNELEGAPIDTIKSAIAAKAKFKWTGAGMERDKAAKKGADRANNLSLDEAYVWACFSCDDTALADYLLRPGGTFWGYNGTLRAYHFLGKYVKPG